MKSSKKSKPTHLLTDDEFAELKIGAADALSHAQGKKMTLRNRSLPVHKRPQAFGPERIRAIRMRLNVSQPIFAEMLYVKKDTEAKWEQGLRKPSGAALRLLEIAEKRPDVFASAD
jgi:putative transcriptional regulator